MSDFDDEELTVPERLPRGDRVVLEGRIVAVEERLARDASADRRLVRLMIAGALVSLVSSLVLIALVLLR